MAAIVALLVGSTYLVWRTSTLGVGWQLGWTLPLYLTELWSFSQLLVFTVQAWRLSEPVSALSAESGHQSWVEVSPSDVIINADGADRTDLERTLVGVDALTGRRNVWVLDGVERETMRSLTVAFDRRRFGALSGRSDRNRRSHRLRYVVDPAVRTGPAAAIHRLAESELYVWLDAGQVPMPDLIADTQIRFADPILGVCQSAVGLLNVDSLVHLRHGRDEEALLREVIGPGLDRLGSGPWFGPGSIIRRAAIDEIGGFNEHDPAAVERALIHLHRAGWSSAYEARPLVRGVAPDTLDDYLQRRRHRAVATLRVFMTPQNPLAVRDLNWKRAMVPVGRALSFGTGARQLIAVAVLIATLLSGHLPFTGPIEPLFAFWAVAAVTAMAARRALGRGTMAVGDWTRHGWRTLGADLAALEAVVRRPGRASVATHPSERSGIRALGRMRLLTTAIVALDLAILTRGITVFKPDLLPVFSTRERVLIMAVGVAMLAPMVDVLQVVVLRKQRRRQFRLGVGLDIEVGSTRTRTVDLAPGGVGLIMQSEPSLDVRVPVRIRLPTIDGRANWIDGSAITRSAAPHSDGLVRVGLEFDQLGDDARLALISYCMIGHAANIEDREVAEASVAHFHDLKVDRRRRHHHLLQALTATAGVSAVLTLLLGPNAVAVAADEVKTIDQICAVGADGPVGDVAVSQVLDGVEQPLGVTGEDGCLAIDRVPASIELRATYQSLTHVDRPTVADGQAVFTMAVHAVRLLDSAGRPVPNAGVRYFTDRWRAAAPTDEAGLTRYEVLGPGASVELSWQGRRTVVPTNGETTTVIMGRIDGGGLAADRTVKDIDRGAGWEPFTDELELLPGRFVLRRVDGSTVKAELSPGHVYDVATGRQTDLGVAVPSPERDASDDTPVVTTEPDAEPTTTTSAVTLELDDPQPTSTGLTNDVDPTGRESNELDSNQLESNETEPNQAESNELDSNDAGSNDAGSNDAGSNDAGSDDVVAP